MVVTNHALLIADSKGDGGLFNEFKHLIIDEAHNIEREATGQHTEIISESQLKSFFNAFQEEGRVLSIIRAYFNSLEGELTEEETEQKLQKLLDSSAKGLETCVDFFEVLGSLESFIKKGSDNGESATRIPQSISLHESWPTVNESVINIQANLNTFRLILEDLETLADDGYRNEIDLVLNNQISKIDFSLLWFLNLT